VPDEDLPALERPEPEEDLLAPLDARLVPASEDLAREPLVLLPELPDFDALDAEPDPLERDPAEPADEARRAADLEPPLADLELLLDARPPLLELLDEPPKLLSLSVHLPERTRCAASATASAMMEPSRVALDTTLEAA
jgi:hypothetical protein